MMPAQTDEEFFAELQEHPDRHRHAELAGIIACAMVDGSVSLLRFDAHSRVVDMGSNGGVRCDVRRGPCSCGAWH